MQNTLQAQLHEEEVVITLLILLEIIQKHQRIITKEHKQDLLIQDDLPHIQKNLLQTLKIILTITEIEVILNIHLKEEVVTLTLVTKDLTKALQLLATNQEKAREALIQGTKALQLLATNLEKVLVVLIRTTIDQAVEAHLTPATNQVEVLALGHLALVEVLLHQKEAVLLPEDVNSIT